MENLHVSSCISTEMQFKQKLVEICESGKKTLQLQKDSYFKLIEELKEAVAAQTKTFRQYYILKRLVIQYFHEML